MKNFAYQQVPNVNTLPAEKKPIFNLSSKRTIVGCLCTAMLILMVLYQMGIVTSHHFIMTPEVRRSKHVELLEESGVIFLCDGFESPDFRPCLCYYDSATLPENYTIPEMASIQDTQLILDLGGRCAITISAAGRLGNQMCEYAVIYALSRTNKRPAFMLTEMDKNLRKHFNLSMPVLSENLEKSKGVWKSEKMSYWMVDSYVNLTGTFRTFTGWPYSWTYFHHLRDEIIREFKFNDNVVDSARQKLLKLRSGRETVTYVGVHARRSDYVKTFQSADNRGVMADKYFFGNATDYFRSRYPDCIFVVASDDLKWCRENIENSEGDVYFVGDAKISSPIMDLALLSSCNHSIITIGTFGFWTAYLAGGETVHYTNYSKPGVRYAKVMRPDKLYLPEWIPIAADRSSIL